MSFKDHSHNYQQVTNVLKQGESPLVEYAFHDILLLSHMPQVLMQLSTGWVICRFTLCSH